MLNGTNVGEIEIPPGKLVVVGKFDANCLVHMSIDLKRLKQMSTGSYGKKATAVLLVKELIAVTEMAITYAENVIPADFERGEDAKEEPEIPSSDAHQR